MSTARDPVTIVGAGLAGALLAVLLARRGYRVQLLERRPDPRQALPESGRSINLALAARGLRALEAAGVIAAVRPLLIPMRGRMVHEPGAVPALLPYGQREHEVIYSVGRAELNRVLIEAATAHPGVQVRFGTTCTGIEPAGGSLQLRTADGAEYREAGAVVIACDGAGSAVRAALVRAGQMQVREDWLDHDYKELTIPAHGGRPVLEQHALHVWPRGGFMLIALPNTDGTFTATLFLPRTGPVSFASLTDREAVDAFFAREFADAVPLMPGLAQEFAQHPQGQLGTVHCSPWHQGGRVLLLGDAAHAIVPFHGQGMNAAFEDCALLDALLADGGDWASLFTRYSTLRRPDTEAIAQMAVENYTEMRDTVRDPGFVRRKALAMALERRFPQRFIPRYSMVMFHPEIGYAEALRRGAVQAQILAELDAAHESADDARASRLVSAHLTPLA